MWKLVEPLLDWLKKYPLGRELLLVLAIPAAAVGISMFFIKDPEAWRLATSYRSLAICIAALGLWLASLLWRLSRPKDHADVADLPEIRDPHEDQAATAAHSRTQRGKAGRFWLLRASSGLLAGASLAASGTLAWRSFPDKIFVRIYFDHVSHGGGQSVVRLLEAGDLFAVEAIEAPLVVNSPGPLLTVADALSAAAVAEVANPVKMIPVVVTRSITESGGVAPILAQPTRAGAVVSTLFAGGGTVTDPRVQRYVATSIALEALNSYYMRRYHVDHLPTPRAVDVNKGCLGDFQRYPADFVEQAQNPKLCRQERADLRRVFGEPVVQALEATLTNIGASGKAPASAPTTR